MNRKTKILIIRFSSIGDIILTTPVIRCIKLQHKNVELHYLTKYKYKDILFQNPYLDSCHYYNNNFSELGPQKVTIVSHGVSLEIEDSDKILK